MNINVELQPNCRAIVHLHATTEEVTKHRNALLAQYGRGVKMPGYRPGKVPKAVILKRYGDEIQAEMERQVANDGLRQAIRNEGLEVLNVINVSDQLLHENDQSFSCSVELSLVPTFQLPEYTGIPVTLPRIEVSEAAIEHDLLHLRERHQSYEDVERPAAMGDVAILSNDAMLDGQAMAEAMPDAPEHLRTLSEQWFLLDAEDDFLPGFYAGVEGITKDETRTLDFTLPEDFGFEPLRGRTLQLAITCGGVREKRVPDLDAAFAEKLGGEGMTVDGLRQEVAEALRRRLEEARDASKASQVLEHLSTKIEFELPQEVVNRAAQRRANDIAQRALRQGIDQEELLKNEEVILSNASQQARQDVKIRFILDEVAKKESLSVADAQIQMALAQMAARSQMPVKKFLAQAQKDRLIEGLREDLLLQNAIEFLKDHAKVEETEPEPVQCETHGSIEGNAAAAATDKPD